MWNYDQDLYIIDLYNFEYKILYRFFEVAGNENEKGLSPTLYLSNLRRQMILTYFTGLHAPAHCAYYEDSNPSLKAKSVLEISEKYGICRNFESIAECGENFYLLGGTAEIG
jgi:hypothetical protein